MRPSHPYSASWLNCDQESLTISALWRRSNGNAGIFSERTGIMCCCIVSHEDLKLEPEQATAVFRICQKELTNVCSAR